MKRKRRIYDTLKLTDNSREYKMTKREQTLGCPICGPNTGCNRNRDNDYRSWKRYRKSQWKQTLE